jgi:hypothetical protein
VGRGFDPPVFLIEDFGSKQGWDPAKHIRTLPDITGDGRADIVAFGGDGVWTALSTGNGFATPHFVLAEFGFNQGWRVSNPPGLKSPGPVFNPRILADIDHDRKKDIIGFGPAGVWTARATGDGGFATPTFALAAFGSNQWGSFPRFVADLTGDGYLDIIGWGPYVPGAGVGIVRPSLWRALGGPTGFISNPDRILLDFPVSEEGVVPSWDDPVLVGDVDGDGKQDLVHVAYQVVLGDDLHVGEHTMVARSTTAPQPALPLPPIAVQITDATSTTLKVSWQRASSDARYFVIHTVPHTIWDGAAPATTHTVLSGLSPDTEYCVSVKSVSWWGVSEASPSVCARTTKPSTSITLYVHEAFVSPSYFPHTGDVLTITWIECIAGTGTPGSYWVKVFHDSEEIYRIRRPAGMALGCHNSENLSSDVVTTHAREGDHNIRVCVDTDNEVSGENCVTDEYVGSS